MISVPLAVSGALLALNAFGFIGIAGTTLNIYSQVGLITLVGLITKHGILMCEVAKEEQLNHGKTRVEAITEAAKVRLRPILMTSFAFILGVLPLAVSTGAGSGARTSMGITVVAGMTTATLFGIFIIPMLFIIIETLGPGLFTNRKKNHD